MYMMKSYDFSQNYALHLWESNAWSWFLERLSLDTIREVDTSFFCVLRKVTLDDAYDVSRDKNCTIYPKSQYRNGIGMFVLELSTGSTGPVDPSPS